MDYKIQKIQARDLPDLWFQSVSSVLDNGRKFKIDRGSYEGQTRLEFDYFIGHIKDPSFGSGTPQILPDIPAAIGIPNPVEFEYVYGGGNYSRSYIEYIMTSVLNDGESYTYGERLTKFPINYGWAIEYNSYLYKDILVQDEKIWDDVLCYESSAYYEGYYLNQIELAIWLYKNKGHRNKDILVQDEKIWDDVLCYESSAYYEGYYLNQIELAIWLYKNKGHRNNQIVLQIAKPTDMLLQDPPCLRHIDTRIQDNKLHFIIYFRSWDLWAGMPANLAGIEALQQYMANEIGVQQGEFIVESKGLHLYGYAEDLARLRTMKNISKN